MKTSESIGKLAEALANVQAEMPPIPKNGKNKFLGNEYVLLDDIVTAANKLLPKHGLAVLQMPITLLGEIGVTTRLAHSSGEWIESTITLPMNDEKGKSSAQVAGSVITYLRRYCLGALLGIASESDDDGNGKPQPKQTTQPEPAPANGKPQADTKTPAASKNGAKPFNFIEWAVSDGVAENEHSAKNIFAGLNLGSKPISEWKELALDYRAFREGGMKAEFAFEHVNTGNKPGKEN